MKKIILFAALVTGLTVLPGCSTVMKSEKTNIELKLPEKDWSVIADDENSYIISESSNMISVNIMPVEDLNEVILPETEEELLSTFTKDIADISQIEDFTYNTSDTSKSVYYKQTINNESEVSVILYCDSVTNEKRITATAALNNADEGEIKKIGRAIKGFM